MSSSPESSSTGHGAQVAESLSAGFKFFSAIIALAVLVALWILTRETDGALWRSYSVTMAMLNIIVTYGLCALWYVMCGPGQQRLRLFRVILITFSLGSVVGLLELPAVVLRYNYESVFGNESENTWLQLSSNINKPDPELIHIHWPHSEYKGEVVGNLAYFGIAPAPLHPFDLRYDHNGFRNDDDLTQADVVVIGDSFIEANMIPTEQTVVKQVQKRLGLTTANLGQCNYGLRQELEVLKRFGRPLKPKLVLWFLFGGNDLRDVTAYENKKSQFGSKMEAARPLKNRMITRNALIALSRMTTPARTTPSARALARSGLFTLKSGDKERVYFGQTNGPWAPHEWQVTTETVSEAKAVCDEMGAKFVLVFISRKFRIYRDYVSLDPDSLAASWDVNTLPQALAQWCASQGVDFVDTIPAMKSVLDQGQHAYFVDDVHWNTRGHEVAAEAVVKHLQDQGWTQDQANPSSP